VKTFMALAAVSAAALAAVPASAQTATTAPVGGRVELQLGLDRVKVSLDDVGSDQNFKDNGTVFGIGGGYDFAVGNNVTAGFDLEATETSIEEGDDFAEVEGGRDLYAGGRVSFGVSQNATAYVKAGYTNFRVKGKVGDETDSEHLGGWRLGGGAQFGIGGRGYLGGEYRYSNYENDVSRHQLVATLGTRF
jgi:outer membrane immunogenic protein